MKDLLLEKFFEHGRWEYAIDKAVGKDINYSELRNLKSVETRTKMLVDLYNRQYEIAPPHTAEIPKGDGTFRTVYVNEPIDRVFLSITNDLLMETCKDMIHPSCKSYQSGIGCGAVVQVISRKIADANGKVIGWKADFTKYFDTVPIEAIDKAFKMVEEKHGESAIMAPLYKYYHQGLYFDTDGELKEKYQSLKQGCAVASWLADVVLYELDEKLSALNGYYVRYSDDTLFVGEDYVKAMEIMQTELAKFGMTLNPKKVEFLSSERWFKFLGFSVKGSQISISEGRLKTFQKEIMSRTVKCKGITKKRAIRKVLNYLYVGDGKHAWAEQMLGIVNSQRDILLLNEFVMDCIRAVETGKTKVGGLGYEHHADGVVTRGIGKNVKSNRAKTDKEIQGYHSMMCMRNAMKTHMDLYKAMVTNL